MSTPTERSKPFYVTGGTLPASAPCYVERTADRELLEGLMGGEFCYVLNTRQMGKSSLMVRTTARLRDRGACVAVLDLTSIGQNLSADQWYAGLMVALGSQLFALGADVEDALFDWSAQHEQLGPLQRFFEGIEQVVLPRVKDADTRLVIFVDEIDAVRSLPFSTDELFVGIRACYNARATKPIFERLTFCLLGVATPADLIQDTRMSPFNIGRRIHLTDFTRAESALLAVGLSAGEDALRRILYWTGGHPYMTQRLCKAAAEEPEAVGPAEVDRLCVRLFLSRAARETDDNLAFVRGRMLRSEVDLASLLERYAQIRRGRPIRDDESDPLAPVLRLSGIVRVEAGLLKVRNPIYHQVFDKAWVAENMPDAEVRRQKAAYRRGLIRASAVGIGAISVVTVLAGAALYQAGIARKARNQAMESASRATKASEENARLAGSLAVSLKETRSALGKAAAAGTAARKAADRAASALQAEQRANDAAIRQASIARAAAVRAEKNALAERRATGIASRAREVARYNLYIASMNLAQAAYYNNDFAMVERLLTQTHSFPERNFEWDYLYRLTHRELGRLRFSARPIFAMCLSPLGDLVAANDFEVTRIASISSGRTLMEIPGGSFQPDGAFSATDPDRFVAQNGGTVHVHSVRTGKPIFALEGAVSARFVNGGRRLAGLASEGRIGIWDAADGRMVEQIPGDNHTIFAASENGRIVACRSRESVAIWDLQTKRTLARFQPHPSGLLRMSLSPDGRLLATSGTDGSASVWDARTGGKIGDLGEPAGQVFALQFSSDGSRLMSGGLDQIVQIWDPITCKQISTVRGSRSRVYGLGWFPDNVRIATAGGENYEPGEISIWNTRDTDSLVLTGHRGSATRCAISPDSKHLITSGRDGTVRIWDPRNGNQNHAIAPGGVAFTVGFTPDGRYAYAGGSFAKVLLYDPATGREAWRIEVEGTVLDVAFSRDGRHVAVVEDHKGMVNLRLFDRETRRLLWSAPSGYEAEYSASVLFSRTGERVYCSTAARTVNEFETETGRKLRSFVVGNVQRMAISSDDRLLAVATMGLRAQVWDLPTGRLRYQLAGHKSAVAAVAFSADGKRIVTAGGDRTVRIWDSRTGSQALSIPGGSAWVWDLAIAPDGSHIATAGGTYDHNSQPGDVRLWVAR